MKRFPRSIAAVAAAVAFAIACGRSETTDPEPSAASEAPPAAEAEQPMFTPVHNGLTYAKAASGEVTFSEWSERDLLQVGVDNANLRSAPDLQGEVVATLPMGTNVAIVEPGTERTTLLERINRWYEVRTPEGDTGYLYGSLLTPLVYNLDLDGDGGDEVVSVTFSPDFAPRVRVAEPQLPADADRVLALDLEMGRSGKGGEAHLSVHSSPSTRWALIKVRLCDGDRCRAKYVSYLPTPDTPLGTLAAVDGDPSALTFVAGGIRMGPNHPVLRPKRGRLVPREGGGCGTDVLFSERFNHKYGPIEPIQPEDLDVEGESRGGIGTITCHYVGNLSGGPYDGNTVISCVAEESGKSEPDHVFVVRFAQRAEKRWTLLRAASDREYREDIEERLVDRGITLDLDDGALVEGLGVGPRMQRPGIRYQYHTADWAPQQARVLFEDPCLGPVYSASSGGDGRLYVPQPEGGALIYDYDWGNEGFPKIEGYHAAGAGCWQAPEVLVSVVDIERADLRPASAEGISVFTVADDHPANETLYETFRRRPGASRETFLETPPQYLWEDPFGRLVQFVRDDVKPAFACEPVVYLYGIDEPVQITLAPDTALSAAAPPAEGTGWRLLPTGAGGVRDPRTGVSYPYLFWEGQRGLFDRPETGQVVAADQVRTTLRRALSQRGLVGREIEDFVSAWAPTLEAHRHVRIAFYPREDIDDIFPMTVSPAPDTLIRVLMDYAPADGPPRGRLPEARPPARKGFALVEWGGIERIENAP